MSSSDAGRTVLLASEPYIRAARLYTPRQPHTPWWRTYGRRIVFKTAGGSQALEPSCDLVLPQRAGPIALRLEAEFQYTRIFNERPTVSPLSFPSLCASSRAFSLPRLLRFFLRFFYTSFSFSSFSYPASPAYSPDAFSSFAPYVFLFPPLSFFKFPSIYTERRTRSPTAESSFCISPPRKRGIGEDASRL